MNIKILKKPDNAYIEAKDREEVNSLLRADKDIKPSLFKPVAQELEGVGIVVNDIYLDKKGRVYWCKRNHSYSARTLPEYEKDYEKHALHHKRLKPDKPLMSKAVYISYLFQRDNNVKSCIMQPRQYITEISQALRGYTADEKIQMIKYLAEAICEFIEEAGEKNDSRRT